MFVLGQVARERTAPMTMDSSRPGLLPSRALWVAADSTRVQLMRYLVVGGVAFAVDFTVLVVLAESFHVGHLVAAGIGFFVGLLVNYQLSVVWVFRHRSLSNRYAEFVVFAMVGLIGLGWTELILFGGTDMLGLDYRISKILAVMVVLFWNFGMRKILLFRVGALTDEA